MKILVTGASGFIGQHVVRELLKLTGVEITATTRDLNRASSLDFFHKVNFVEVDLGANEQDFFQKLGSPDRMIHLAWSGLPNYKDSFHLEKNLPDNWSFISQMIQAGLSNLTVVGTCFEYGMIEGELNESMETFPSNPYGQAKDLLRKKIEDFSQVNHFSWKWLRLFYMYGNGQAASSIISQIDNAVLKGEKIFNMSGGEQVRDYLPVTTVANYIVQCALQDEIQGIINCCSGKPTKLIDFVSNYLKEKNYTITLNRGFYPYPDYEPMSFWGNHARLQEVLNGKK